LRPTRGVVAPLWPLSARVTDQHQLTRSRRSSAILPRSPPTSASPENRLNAVLQILSLATIPAIIRLPAGPVGFISSQ
ncbi:hypothetical protein PanWU01x14_184750, partial [Parasponia andersonii]